MGVDKRSFVGIVVSNKMDKTVVVKVERSYSHSIYHKVLRKSKKYYVDDSNNKCKEGDRVVIIETKPISKTKRWQVKEILSSGGR